MIIFVCLYSLPTFFLLFLLDFFFVTKSHVPLVVLEKLFFHLFLLLKFTLSGLTNWESELVLDSIPQPSFLLFVYLFVSFFPRSILFLFAWRGEQILTKVKERQITLMCDDLALVQIVAMERQGGTSNGD